MRHYGCKDCFFRLIKCRSKKAHSNNIYDWYDSSFECSSMHKCKNRCCDNNGCGKVVSFFQKLIYVSSYKQFLHDDIKKC